MAKKDQDNARNLQQQGINTMNPQYQGFNNTTGNAYSGAINQSGIDKSLINNQYQDVYNRSLQPGYGIQQGAPTGSSGGGSGGGGGGGGQSTAGNYIGYANNLMNNGSDQYGAITGRFSN